MNRRLFRDILGLRDISIDHLVVEVKHVALSSSIGGLPGAFGSGSCSQPVAAGVKMQMLIFPRLETP